ncbi:hypothetical protein SmB9_32990 [Sphingosinicella microcystinivorans]|uniref:Cytochrome c domain-containing protein n=2 Tax=Sphingosinicella microcystinivorans TaxID=335406 RepID=A0AAD1DAU3_SPHMI|nr:hypothetical protein DFR51_3016 [Sphingosinicella microcystinivorans]BBE35641.1 hypothetical protein SmB9_32990 [Sphingosinicella microcystinivorans]
MRLAPIIAVLAACIGMPVSAEDVAPSFARDVVPILKTRCVACHMSGAEPGKMSLVPAKAYAALVGAKSTVSPMVRIQPSVPERSYLLHKLEGTHVKAGGSGTRMPLGGAPLPADKIALIRNWIVAGAPNN